jgi:hypothetical protein
MPPTPEVHNREIVARNQTFATSRSSFVRPSGSAGLTLSGLQATAPRHPIGSEYLQSALA